MRLKEAAERSAAILADAFGPGWKVPALFLQTGTGFNADNLFDDVIGTMDADELPGMPSASSPAGHAMQFVYGQTAKTRLLLCAGRRHFYEGHGTLPCVLPACAAAAAGIDRFALIGTAGGVRLELKPGSLLLLTDMVNNLGASPLQGECDFGARMFVDMRHAFSQELNGAFVNAAVEVGLQPSLGTYQANPGPQFETPAEVEICRNNGVDAVGMSLALETVALRAFDAKVMAIALISNRAANCYDRHIDHLDIEETCRQASPGLVRALRQYLRNHMVTDAETW